MATTLEEKRELVTRAKASAWWIWVRDTRTGNERWAKGDGVPLPVTLGAAVALCADWNTRAARHEYTVRPYSANGTTGPSAVVGVRVEGFGGREEPEEPEEREEEAGAW